MRVRSFVRRRGVDALVVVLAVLAQAEAWFATSQTPRIVTVPAALLWTLPLLARSRFPLAAPAAVFLALASESLLTGEAVPSSQVNPWALLAAFAVAGTHPNLQSAVSCAAIGYASLVAIIASDRPELLGVIPVVLFAAVAWGIGRTVAERGRQTAALEERSGQLERSHAEAVASERATIARELHDVIAHSVSVMTVQAGAARLLLEEDVTQARQSLLAVEETGRQALGEMRRLLGILRGDDDNRQLAPQPGISDIDALIEQVRGAGLPVDVIVEGETKPLPPGVDLAAYRVVQEALTNTLKHAGAARAEVSIRYRPTALELAVTNDGFAQRNGRGGHGLVGMRERIALYGGEFDAGPRSGGGYAVRAALPLDTPPA